MTLRILIGGTEVKAELKVFADGAWQPASLRALIDAEWVATPPEPVPGEPAVTFSGDGTIVVNALVDADLIAPTVFGANGEIIVGGPAATPPVEPTPPAQEPTPPAQEPAPTEPETPVDPAPALSATFDANVFVSTDKVFH